MKITKDYLRQLIRESLTGVDAPEEMSDEDYEDLKRSNQLRGASPVGADAAFESIKLAVSNLSDAHKKMILHIINLSDAHKKMILHIINLSDGHRKMIKNYLRRILLSK